MGDLLLGIDVGTNSTKGVLVTQAGEIVARHEVPHRMLVPRPGWAEHDAEGTWWGDVVKVCGSFFGNGTFRGSDVRAVGISAIGPCVVPLDASFRPLRPGILYGVDVRASSQIDELDQAIGPDAIMAISGMALTSQAVGPKIRWIQQEEPDVWKKTRYLTTASSYIIAKLTGELVMDRHTASHYMPLFDHRTFEWSDTYMEHVAARAMLPDLKWSDEVAGLVTVEASRQTGLPVGTPVTAGAVDALSEAISVGVVDEGDLMIMYGSTTFFILVLDEPRPNPITWTTAGAFRGQYNMAAGMATTGELTRWLRDTMARDLGADEAFRVLFEEAREVGPGAGGLLLLPYFSGERTPIQDPKARGVLAGLGLSHGRGHIFRAALEGVGFGIRHNLETFQSLGMPVKRVVSVGGGTRTDLWPQIVSDISGVVQEIPETTIGASYGDAFLAGLGAGLVSQDDLRHWVREGRQVEPRSDYADLYEELYGSYLELYEQTRRVVHRLTDLPSRHGTGRS